MTFVHETIELDQLTSRDLPEGRFYSTPEGYMPSVTTVIGWASDKNWLKDWEDRVGAEEAKRVRTRAALRGTAVHSIAESYLLNDPHWKRGVMPSDLASFLQVRDLLDRHVGRIFGVEVPLWSSRLMTAGRTDLLAEWDGIPSIIDFKTSRRIKTDDDVKNYMIQESCYGQMAEERTGLEIPQIVTLMMVDHEHPQVWVADKADWAHEVERVFTKIERPKFNVDILTEA